MHFTVYPKEGTVCILLFNQCEWKHDCYNLSDGTDIKCPTIYPMWVAACILQYIQWKWQNVFNHSNGGSGSMHFTIHPLGVTVCILQVILREWHKWHEYLCPSTPCPPTLLPWPHRVPASNDTQITVNNFANHPRPGPIFCLHPKLFDLDDVQREIEVFLQLSNQFKTTSFIVWVVVFTFHERRIYQIYGRKIHDIQITPFCLAVCNNRSKLLQLQHSELMHASSVNPVKDTFYWDNWKYSYTRCNGAKSNWNPSVTTMKC